MATRPTDTLTWGGTQVDPGEAQKAAGYSPGDEPPAEWLNYFQALAAEWVGYLDEAVEDHSHGIILEPVPLSIRQVIAGTWTINSNGSITEGSAGNGCRLPLSVPVGSMITGALIRGIAAGSNNQFALMIQSSTDNGGMDAGLSSQVPSNNGITGTAQDIDIDLDEGDYVTTVYNKRYFLLVTSEAGSAGNRTITSAFIKYKRL